MSDDRSVMHLDMNAFFASVEQQANPALRGKPVAVIGSAGRTVITTSSYEARAFGVKTGMSKYEALRKCPQLILVVGDNRKYTWTSSRIRKLMLRYTPLVEVFSIDEAFLDVTGSRGLFGSAERIAELLKGEIRRDFGLTCSVGIAPNKLLAKLASDMKKPDGLTVILSGEVRRMMEKLPIGALCGIGRKTERQLNLLGIRTCGELARYPVDALIRKFGVVGERLHQMGLGLDDSPVVPADEEDEVKSVGHSMTLDRDIDDRDEILKHLLQLAEMVGRRARRYNVEGRTVTLSVRYADFETTFARQESLPRHINLSDDIYRTAVAILDCVTLEQRVRLLGIRLSNLRYGSNQMPLFEEDRKKTRVAGAMDSVNDRFGNFTVTFGTLVDDERKEKGSRVISPAWRPEGIRSVDVS